MVNGVASWPFWDRSDVFFVLVDKFKRPILSSSNTTTSLSCKASLFGRPFELPDACTWDIRLSALVDAVVAWLRFVAGASADCDCDCENRNDEVSLVVGNSRGVGFDSATFNNNQERWPDRLFRVMKPANKCQAGLHLGFRRTLRPDPCTPYRTQYFSIVCGVNNNMKVVLPEHRVSRPLVSRCDST